MVFARTLVAFLALAALGASPSETRPTDSLTISNGETIANGVIQTAFVSSVNLGTRSDDEPAKMSASPSHLEQRSPQIRRVGSNRTAAGRAQDRARARRRRKNRAALAASEDLVTRTDEAAAKMSATRIALEQRAPQNKDTGKDSETFAATDATTVLERRDPLTYINKMNKL
ncbi:hypothetical protein HK102_003769 [Quaeritorhiza haematococci]|nr:hypothetical protein HK102_003769 [Quaeritorhiza haematococci]